MTTAAADANGEEVLDAMLNTVRTDLGSRSRGQHQVVNL